MKRYPKYKDSGVEWLGYLPEHWTVKKLKFVANVQPSNVDKKTLDDEIPVLLCNYSDVYKNESITNKIEFMKASATQEEIIKFSLQKGDVIITKDSESPYDIAVPALVIEDLKNVLCGYHLTQIRSKKIDGNFLLRLFQCKRFNGQFVVNANGVTRFGLPSRAINDAFIGFPSPEEQKAIAYFLDHKLEQIEQYIRNKKQLIELLNEQKTAIINRAVTKGINPNAPMKHSGIEWLGEIPAHWEVKKLKYVKNSEPNSFVDGPFGSNLKSIHYIKDGAVYVVESGFITSGKFILKDFKTISREHFETIKRSSCKGGDIIISKIGANFGMSGILPELNREAVISGNSLKLTINLRLYDTKYIHYHLLSLKHGGTFDLIVNATAQPALSLGTMNNIAVVIPPIYEQQAIVSFIEQESAKIDLAIAQIEKEIELIQEYRTTLISDAVTGKIDVRELSRR